MNEPTYHKQVSTAHQACEECNKKNERPGHTRPGALICTPTKKPRPHARASQPQHKSRRTPARRTVRPVDGQTGAKRTRGRGSSRKRVRSPYSEPETIARGKWSETHTERGRRAGQPPAVAPAPLTCARSRTKHGQHHHARRAQKAVGRVAPGKPQAHAPHTLMR